LPQDFGQGELSDEWFKMIESNEKMNEIDSCLKIIREIMRELNIDRMGIEDRDGEIHAVFSIKDKLV